MSVIIIGGGLSGMAAAFHLRQRGIPVVLLERAPRLGGNIQTHVRDGFLLENGPNSFFDREPSMRELARALGVESLIQPATDAARKRYVYTRGRLRALPRPLPSFLGSNVLPFTSRLRVLGDLFTRRSVRDEDESLARFGRRHLGHTATSVVLDAVQSGLFTGDLETLSARAATPRPKELPQPGALCSFRGGLQRMVDALIRRLGTIAHTRAHVERLTPVPGGWRVVVREQGERTELEASQVVVCTPANTAAGLLRETDAELGSLLGSITYAPVAVVHVGFAPESVPKPDGAGFLVPASEKRRLLGAIHASTLFPWRAEGERVLYTCMVGGTRQPELASLPPEELVTLVREELAHITGVRAEPVVTDVVRWPCALPQYTLGHEERLAAIDRAVARWPGLHLSGNAYRGISMVDCVRDAATLAERLAARVGPTGGALGLGSQQQA
ncbi:protoporphyrinogen oxidase [Archangium violaceum]|uniref:protoporphyrinogen oxidase n=1 Tax=Archangium violaceum TaxID=83451 RepID=UPI00194E2682|nr:protoporphyrinogen oxidase [Archangium violaceum]QRN94749.1 protoporphyrinogen oxidase [Archangium violaceum]